MRKAQGTTNPQDESCIFVEPCDVPLVQPITHVTCVARVPIGYNHSDAPRRLRDIHGDAHEGEAVVEREEWIDKKRAMEEFPPLVEAPPAGGQPQAGGALAEELRGLKLGKAKVGPAFGERVPSAARVV